MVEYQFFAALARAAVASTASADHRSELIGKLTARHEQLRTWANNNAGNFGSRADLVAAELARLHGEDVEAIRLYDRAVRAAADVGFCHIEAIAAEVAAVFIFLRSSQLMRGAPARPMPAGAPKEKCAILNGSTRGLATGPRLCLPFQRTRDRWTR
jgi:hypothetical protein